MACLFASCLKDNGNYDYTPLKEVTITGLDDSYRFILQEPRTLSPQISTDIDPSNLIYCWRIGADTLSKSKELSYTFQKVLMSSEQLVFDVLDKTTNVRYSKRMDLAVVSPFQTGWMLFGDLNNTPTLSFCSYEAGYKFYPDVYAEVNKTPLTGKAKMVKQLTYVDGFTGAKCDRISVVCEGGKSAELDGTSLLKKKFYEDEFKAGTLNISTISSEYYYLDYALFLVSNGKIYSKVPGMLGTPDEAGYQYPLDGDDKGYSVGSYYGRGYKYSDFFIAVDELNKRYVRFGSTLLSKAVTSIAVDEASSIKTINPENLEGKSVWMGQANNNNVISILKTDAGKYVLHLLSCSGYEIWTLLARYEFPDGVINDQTCFAPHAVNPYLMISNGSKLMALNLDALSAGAAALNDIASYSGNIIAMYYAYDSSKSVNEFGIAIQTNSTASSLLLVNPSLTAHGEIIKRYDNIPGKLVSIWRKII